MRGRGETRGRLMRLNKREGEGERRERGDQATGQHFNLG